MLDKQAIAQFLSKNIFALFSQKNITFFIALFSFIMSLWNFFKDLWNNRSKLRLIYKSCAYGEVGSRYIMYFEMAFENCSKLPISISRMILKVDKDLFEFKWTPERILKKEYKRNHTTIDEKTFFSEQFPHTIDCLGIWGGFYVIVSNSLIDISKIKNNKTQLLLYTNRGKKKFKLSVTDDTFNVNKNQL